MELISIISMVLMAAFSGAVITYVIMSFFYHRAMAREILGKVMIDAVSLMAFLNEAEEIILKHFKHADTEYIRGVFRGVDHVRQYVEALIDIKEHER